MARILIVDDDPHIREVIRFALESSGYQFVEAKDGAAAIQAVASGGIDLIVLDIVMPELDGLEVCKSVRKTSTIPIIFLSSRDDEIDRVLGLEIGADDYITKPFSPRELVARVKVVLRRARVSPGVVDTQASSARDVQPALIEHGPIRLDLLRHECTYDDNLLVLTVTEFALVGTLLRHPGRVYSRNDLVAASYEGDHFITDRTVDSHIRRIRKKFATVGADPIETIYGVGYRLREALVT